MTQNKSHEIEIELVFAFFLAFQFSLLEQANENIY